MSAPNRAARQALALGAAMTVLLGLLIVLIQLSHAPPG